MNSRKKIFLTYIIIGSFILLFVTISFIKKFPYDYYYLTNLLRRTLEGKDEIIEYFWIYFLIIFPFFNTEFYLEKKLKNQASVKGLGTKYTLRLAVKYFFATVLYFFLVPSALGQSGDSYMAVPFIPIIAFFVALLASLLGGLRILILKYSFEHLPTSIVTATGIFFRFRKIFLVLNSITILVLFSIFYYDFSTQGIYLHLSDDDNTIQIAKLAVTSKDFSRCQNADNKDICLATYIMSEYEKSAIDVGKIDKSQIAYIQYRIATLWLFNLDKNTSFGV